MPDGCCQWKVPVPTSTSGFALPLISLVQTQVSDTWPRTEWGVKATRPTVQCKHLRGRVTKHPQPLNQRFASLDQNTCKLQVCIGIKTALWETCEFVEHQHVFKVGPKGAPEPSKSRGSNPHNHTDTITIKGGNCFAWGDPAPVNIWVIHYVCCAQSGASC